MNQQAGCNQKFFGESKLQSGGIPYIPTNSSAKVNDRFSDGQEGWPMTQDASQYRKVGRIIILSDDNESPMYNEIPLFYEGDDPDLFLGKVVKAVSNAASSVGRVAQKIEKKVNKVTATIKKAAGPLGDVMDVGWKMSPAGMAYTWKRRGLDAVSAVARGERIDRIAHDLGKAGITDVRERMKYAEMVAPFVPGVGTGVAAALGAANALAAGKPITEAIISAARSAIPGGKIAQAGFDIATNLVRGKSPTEAVLSAARAQLGPAGQAAFDTGLALAQGKKIQNAAIAGAGRLLPASPYAADALSFVRAATSGKNIQHAALSSAGRRVLQKIKA